MILNEKIIVDTLRYRRVRYITVFALARDASVKRCSHICNNTKVTGHVYKNKAFQKQTNQQKGSKFHHKLTNQNPNFLSGRSCGDPANEKLKTGM